MMFQTDEYVLLLLPLLLHLRHDPVHIARGDVGQTESDRGDGHPEHAFVRLHARRKRDLPAQRHHGRRLQLR
jgi:hypothetical protein